MSGNADTKMMDKKFISTAKGGKKADIVGSSYVPSFRTKFIGECEALKDCVFDCSDGRQAGLFDANMKRISIYVGSKYDMGAEISVLVDDLIEVKVEKPVPYIGDDVSEQKIYEQRIAQYVKDQARLDSEIKKLYSLVLGQCTEYLISKLKELPTYHEMHLKKDALSLLKAIKAFTFMSNNNKEYEMSLVEADERFRRVYQTKDMSNLQYRKAFDNMVEVIEHYGGTVGLHWGVLINTLEETTGKSYDKSSWMKDYSPEEFHGAVRKAKEKILARMFLFKCDKDRYGPMLAKLQNDHVSGRNAYPSTRLDAYALMNNWNNTYERRAPSVPSQYGSSFAQNGYGTIACWGCGMPGVVLAECKNEECIKKFQSKMSKRKAAAMTKGEQHFNIKTEDLLVSPSLVDGQMEISGGEFSLNDYIGYDSTGCQFTQSGKKVGRKMILLDSQSTHSTFYVRELLKDIRLAPEPLKMLTNGGTIIYYQQGELPNYGTVWFNKEAIANIISMSEAERKGHKISYSPGCLRITNSETEKNTDFQITKDGLYAYVVPEEGTSLLQTIDENESFFTPRQVKQAKLARDMYEMVGRPSYHDFMEIIKNNLLPNSQISVQDVMRAEAIFGKDLGAIQGKTTRVRPDHVPTDYVMVPPNIMEFHSQVVLAIDIMAIDKVYFLLTVSRNIQFTTVEKLVNKKTATLENGISKVIHLYKKRGFNVTVCLADLEFEAIRNVLTKLEVTLNTCGPGEHVPEIERKIRTVKERVRGVILMLPFATLPRIMVVHSVLFSVMWLNFFPPKGGVSRTLSPQAIITGIHADCAKHCRVPFGGYAQVHAEPSPLNDVMVSRTVGGISLGPTGNVQGTYKFMSLLTGELIQARSFTILPMPGDVIARVEAMSPSYNPSWEDFEIQNIDENEGEDGDSEWFDEEDEDSNNNNTLQQDEDDLIEMVGVDMPVSLRGNEVQQPDVEEGDVEEVHEEETEGHVEHVLVDNNDIEPIELVDTEDGENVDVGSDNRVHYTTRSGRNVKMSKHLINNYSLLQLINAPKVRYHGDQSPSVRQAFGVGGMDNVTRASVPGNDVILQCAFTQYSLKQGLRRFPEQARDATIAEMRQLHEMHVFKPIKKEDLTQQERSQVLNSIIFIKEKRCGRIKARACADGRPQRMLYDKSDASSPTVKTESVMLTSVIDASEGRVVGIYDIPGAFLHSTLDEVVHIKVTGTLAKFLVSIDPETYAAFVTNEGGCDVIYLQLTRALYGCLKSALQFWKHLSGNLKSRGYALNPYDSCVANRMIAGSQFTIVWHVDDLKLSHLEEGVVDEELKWLESIYGPLVGSKGLHHTYLGMDLSFEGRKLRVSMIPYFQEIVDEFPEVIDKPASTPAAIHLFDESDEPVCLGKEQSNMFHHTVAKLLWGAIRARPDLLTALSYLTCKVKAPDHDDLKKLIRLVSYLKGTIDLPLILSTDQTRVIKWWVDASFATRKHMRSQTGATMSLGSGCIYSMSRKQKLNTTSSTEAELVAADDAMPQIIWTRQFLTSQGVEVSHNILHQDNHSAMKLEKNGTMSSSRRTRHINIRFFFIKDRITAGDLELQYCPTDQMVGDFFTKPLQGKKFVQFRNIIMGEEASPND